MYFAVGKEVKGINFTRSTEQQQEISDISELGTRRVEGGGCSMELL